MGLAASPAAPEPVDPTSGKPGHGFLASEAGLAPEWCGSLALSTHSTSKFRDHLRAQLQLWSEEERRRME
jgi:hypothetical protein